MRLLTLAAVLIPISLLAAENPFLGTWKLNPAKSKSSPTPVPKELTVTFEQDGDKIRRTANGIDGEGNPVKQTGSIAWDGKDHEIKAPDGSPRQVAVKHVSDRERAITVKRDGQVVTKMRTVISKDGTTMTNTSDGVTDKGEKYHAVTVYEKQ
jgi:hypothetical protein